MSLTRRNLIAWVLLAAAALSWLGGRQLLYPQPSDGWTNATLAPTSPPPFEATMMPATGEVVSTEHDTQTEAEAYGDETLGTAPTNRLRAGIAYLLCFFAVGAAVGAVFFLPQKAAVCGPDGCFLLLGAVAWAFFHYLVGTRSASYLPAKWVLLFTVLFCVRSLWGWIAVRCSLEWCALRRATRRFAAPEAALGTLIAVTLSVFAAGAVLLWRRAHGAAAVSAFSTGLLCLCCIGKFAAELRHFSRQLDNFRSGVPVAPAEGTFARAEQQLRQVQLQHAEAVRTAVANERFKVELIANVSHDLRTPLTSILGYGELLQSETLSPAGQEKLSQLNRKAGYMRDLVDSLFELTKVSSGVLESKREAIDLIRLLEQTVGLFDDKLTAAGLQVRRHYEADALPVVTDGARMHQVFANLLGNAIKYAMPGTRIHLHVHTDGSSCRVRLVNTAAYEMDFAPEQILQRFARGDKARSTQGSGLGLAIAQTYTQSVGGEFRVAIDGDQFSATVTLPL